MATLEDVRKICRALPESFEGEGAQFGFSVLVKGKHKGFVWGWMERIDPKKARVVNNDVLAIRTPGLEAKEVLLGTGHPAFFTEPHYNNYPAILVRIELISPEELEPLLVEAHATMASPRKAA